MVILYPEGKVSPLQEAQMTTLGGNIHPLRVDGTFDDCQRLVKEMFRDEALRRRVRITSANSINLLRWLPQSFYYFYGWAAWRRATGRDEPDVVVPSGNYGNLAAGMLARRMGLPVRRFVAASNANDVVPGVPAYGSSTVRGRRCGPWPTPWMWARRATSSACCGSAAVIWRLCGASCAASRAVTTIYCR